jgi:acetyltransferase-like isoleucine patch superfamily enzyme
MRKAKDLISRVLDMPWVAMNEIRRLVTKPFVQLFFWLNGIHPNTTWRVYGCPIIQRHRGSEISIGKRIWMRSWKTSNPLAPNHPVVLSTRSRDAKIRIGDDVGLTGTVIVAANSVEIGDRVLVGANSTIVDTDFHPLDVKTRQEDILAGKNAPVIIEDDVFIGMNCIILKGVRIGAGAVIGAGSVVAIDIPPYAVAAGNPARVVRPAGSPA